MKINLLLFSLIAINLIVQAQSSEGVKVSNDISSPNPSAMFEVTSDNKGVLFPRVSLTDIFVYQPILGAETNGILVYNTNPNILGGCGKGYYYWNIMMWEKIDETCIPRMSFSEMIALTSQLSDNDIGFKVYVTDTNIPTSEISGASSCTPTTFNPSGVWQFINIAQTHPKITNCIKWTTNISLPTFTCTQDMLICP